MRSFLICTRILYVFLTSSMRATRLIFRDLITALFDNQYKLSACKAHSLTAIYEPIV
jgi:hypothetical protein